MGNEHKTKSQLIEELESLRAKMGEVDKSQADFLQAQKMDTVGLLAGGISHDFNNLITIIIGNTRLALEQIDERDPLRKNIETIARSADRAADLTRKLLAFSRKQILVLEIININDILDGMHSMLRRIIGEDIDLQVVPGRYLWNVKADTTQIEQVLINLAVNARDAIPDGGKLTIETENVVIDKDNAPSTIEIEPSSYVTLSVSDTGTGMSDEVIAHVFEPFFTTKEVGKGTGLGLSTVYGIVKQSGGYTLIDSEVGKGTTIRILLPETEGVAKAIDEHKTTTENLSGTETVLVVEDDDEVRETVSISLQHYGYKVIEAKSGIQALELLQFRANAVDVIMTDVLMPKMRGDQFVNEIRGIWPEMKVIFMSGQDENLLAGLSEREPAYHFIAKPFSPNALVLKVRTVLDD